MTENYDEPIQGRYIGLVNPNVRLLIQENRAILVTLDHHFQQILDIEKPRRPQDII